MPLTSSLHRRSASEDTALVYCSRILEFTTDCSPQTVSSRECDDGAPLSLQHAVPSARQLRHVWRGERAAV